MAQNEIRIIVTATGAEQAAKVLADVAKSGAQLGSVTVTGAKRAEDALTGLGNTAKRVFEIFTGVSLANLTAQFATFAQRSAAELTRMGLENQRVEESFGRMADAVGVHADTMVASLKRASSGIVDTNSIMLASSKALAQGLNQDQLVRIMETARATATLAGKTVSESYNAIAESVTNLNVKQLREFGIVIDLSKAYDTYARSLGTSAGALNEAGQRAALLQEIDEQTRKSRRALTQGELTNAQEIEKAKATWSDFFATMAGGFATAYTASVKWGARFLEQVQIEKDRLDDLGVAWNNYMKRKLDAQGGALPQGAGLTMRTSPRELRELAEVDTGLGRIGGKAVDAASGIDRVKDALLKADQALREMNASMQTGTATGAQFAGVIEQQIAALKAVPEQTVEIKNKILDLQVALAAVNFTAFQQGLTQSLQAAKERESGLLNAVRESVAARTMTVEAGAVAEAQIHVSSLAQQRMVLAQALVAFKGTEAQKLQLLQQTAMLRVQFDEAKSQERIAKLAEEARLLDLGTAGWIAHAEAMNQQEVDRLNAELAITNGTLADQAKALADTNAGWVAHAEAVLAGTTADLEAIIKVNAPLRAYQDTLEEIALKGKLLGSSFDTLAPSIAAVEQEIVRLGKAGQDVTALQEKLAGLKQVQELKGIFTDVFASIGSAISTSIQGIILGTTTMAKAWENLWKSIVLSFVNSGIQRLLKGVQDWLLGLFTGGSSGGFGEGIFGAIISGAGALVEKLSGGGTSLGNPVGSSAGALDLVTTAAKGTASALNAANTGISNFSAGVGAALSGLGVAAGIYGLTQGGSAGSMALSAGGTALSLYSLAVSASQLAVNAGLIGTALPTIGVLLAQGLATVAPTIAAAVGTAVYTAFGSSAVATALLGGGAAAAGGAAAGGAGVGAALGASAGASFLGFVAFMVAGGLAGIAADAEDAAESFKEQLGAVKDALNQAGAAGLLFANLGKHLQESNLAKSLEQLHGALRALGDLDLAVGLNQVIGDAGAQGIMAQVPKLRATVGAAWLAAMDAAVAKGVPIPSRSPGRDLLAPWSGAVGMQSFDDILSQAAGAGRDGFDKLSNLLEHISQSLDENLYKVNATGVRMVDVGAVGALLDKEFLTTSLRNAVVDIGALFGISAGQMGGIGAGEGNWRATPGAGNMPSMAAIASAQAALEAAGFEPGKYAEALEKYLTSIDTNLVNNPAWKKFVDMLHKAGGDTGVIAAINAALGKNMTPMQFYGVAKAATDSLTAALKEQMTARASETDTDALKAIDDSIAAMTETVKAWSSLVTLYTGLPVEMAAIAGDLGKQTAASIDAWRVQMQSFTDAIADSRKELDKAIAGGNIASIAAAAQAVHDQTIAQYNAVLKAVESLHKAIQGILEQAGILVDMMTSVAQLDIRSNGSFATIGSLLGSLQDIAEHGGTAAIRLFAIDKAIQAIIATLPTAIEKFGSEAGPGAITGAVAGAAAPFLAAQQGEINVAKGVALLALLQQQAQTINALATAAIAGVRQWADAAIKGARAAADEVIAGLTRERDAKLKQIDADIKGIEGVAAAYHQRHVDEIDAIQSVAKLYHEKAMAEIKAIEVAAAAAHDARMAEIDAIQETEDAAHEYRAAEMDALSELINKAQEMESAVASMGKFIDQLKQGPVGPGNPADKLALAQQSFAQALAAFNRNPTAGGLTDLQGLAQTMLSLAEPIFSKPSPQFQTLSATTIKQLMAAQALAAAQMTDSQILKAQLAHLQAIDKATTASVGEQIKAIQAADEAAGKKADTLIEVIKKRDEKEQALAETLIKGIEDLDKMEQTIARAMIKTLEDNRDKVTKDFETQTTAVELGLKNTILAIEKAAADEIDHIQKGTAIALKENMDKQIPLLSAQYDAANAQLVAIGDTKVWQTATLAKLEELRVLLAGSVSAESGMARVTEGLYHLHDDEMVLPKGTADRIRSAEMGAGLPDPTAQAVGEIITNWDKYSEAEKQGIITAYNAADDATKQSADRAASYWQASEAQTKRAATRPPDLSNTGPWAPGSGDPLRDPWMAHAVQTKAGDWIYEPGYGPGATPGSVVKFGTGPAPGPPPPGTAPTAPYLPPGPPWLYRGAGSTTLAAGGSMAYGGGYPDGSGPITVVVKLDGKTIGEATLPTIQGDARSGKMRTIILETRAR